MKHKALWVAAIASLVLSACSGYKESKVTKISGKFETDPPKNVRIRVPDILYDSIVPVAQGEFHVAIPTCKTTLGQILAGKAESRFIPDGLPMTVVFDSSSAKIYPKYPERSAQQVFQDFTDAYVNLNKSSKAVYETLNQNDEAAKDSFIANYNAKSDSICFAALAKSDDSFVTALALRNLYGSIPMEKFDSLLLRVDSSVTAIPSIAQMKAIVERKIVTSEGRMFSDFNAGGIRLSDLVGRGKYILVDFWASWCDSCKKEIPFIMDAYRKFHGDDFDVLSIAVWDKPEETKDTAKAYNMTWKIISDTLRTSANQYGIESIPERILFGPDGTILRRGFAGKDIDAVISEYIGSGK